MDLGLRGSPSSTLIRMEASWILTDNNKIEVKKVASVDQAIRDTEPSVQRINQDPSTTTERVRVEQVCYIPRYLLPLLMTITCTPREAWDTLGSIIIVNCNEVL